MCMYIDLWQTKLGKANLVSEDRKKKHLNALTAQMLCKIGVVEWKPTQKSEFFSAATHTSEPEFKLQGEKIK